MQNRDRTAQQPVIVGISGGSGASIGKRIIEILLERDWPVVCTITNGGRQVWAQEMEEPFGRTLHEWAESPHFTFHPVNQVGSPIASGSSPALGMIVAPCSMATVAGIAHGLADNLLRRAADVTIKERRPLALVPRETPLSAIHLENLHKLAVMGVSIVMPAPAFYLKPNSVSDIVDYIAEKALTVLDPVAFPLSPPLQYTGMQDEA